MCVCVSLHLCVRVWLAFQAENTQHPSTAPFFPSFPFISSPSIRRSYSAHFYSTSPFHPSHRKGATFTNRVNAPRPCRQASRVAVVTVQWQVMEQCGYVLQRDLPWHLSQPRSPNHKTVPKSWKQPSAWVLRRRCLCARQPVLARVRVCMYVCECVFLIFYIISLMRFWHVVKTAHQPSHEWNIEEPRVMRRKRIKLRMAEQNACVARVRVCSCLIVYVYMSWWTCLANTHSQLFVWHLRLKSAAKGTWPRPNQEWKGILYGHG